MTFNISASTPSILRARSRVVRICAHPSRRDPSTRAPIALKGFRASF